MKVKKFEYCAVPLLTLSHTSSYVEELNKLGQQGWELCGFEYGCGIFKRQLYKLITRGKKQ